MSTQVETHEFQTEARQLLDLMVHSIYSNKDVFLRELISNASDALDKRRFAALTEPELMESGTELEIWLEPDPEARTLTIRDNGIGMTRDEVKELIGTIARSGTKEFLSKIRESQGKNQEVSPELIGQFGVGFYSSFIVSESVTLVTRKAGEDTATRWESSGDGTYTLAETTRDEPGTSVTLHLKPVDDEDGMGDYTQEYTLRQIVKRFSDFVAYPIRMEVTRQKPKEDAEKKDDDDTSPPEMEEVTEVETLNSMKAIWVRPRDEVTDEEYNEFYKHISHDWNEPLLRISAKIEGTLEYRILIFIPSKAPFDLYHRESVRGVHLYVKRVFIMDDCKELLPEYLRFARGVVDSEDLSLNISREILQQDRQIQRMRKGIVGKILSTLEDLLKEDREKYLTFWGEFGRVLKEGLYGDFENRERLLGISLFASTHHESELTTLEDYIERMKGDQKEIYYMTGESRSAIENSPHLEGLLAEGYEVLLLTDSVDEFWVDRAGPYRDLQFKSVGKGSVDVGGEKDEEKEKEYSSILEFIQDQLSEHVKEVRLSTRLKTSAACLVSDEGDLTPQMEELLRATNQEVPQTKRILELNPGHPILEKMRALFEEDRSSQKLRDYSELLHGQALIAEGGKPAEPGKFSKLISELMVEAIG